MSREEEDFWKQASPRVETELGFAEFFHEKNLGLSLPRRNRRASSPGGMGGYWYPREAEPGVRKAYPQ